MPVIQWQRVTGLQGQTLQTLTSGAKFEIVDATSDGLYVVPQRGKRSRRRVLREEIEAVARVTVDPTILRRTASRELPGNQCTSYIAAIIREVTRPS
jgi:hypothetical protein